MTLVLDAGALVALERGDRELHALLKMELNAGGPPITHGAVLGQAWRGGTGRQANLARALAFIQTIALDEAMGRRAGVLLGRARQDDVVDAAVVLLAGDGDTVFTSDPADLRQLALASGTHLELVAI